MSKESQVARMRTRFGIRKKVIGSATRPRIAVYRSLNNIYLQAINDEEGVTIIHASSLDPEIRDKLKGNGGNTKAAEEVGKLMAARLKKKSLDTIVFDRGGFIYHGRVKAAAEAMRKAGINF